MSIFETYFLLFIDSFYAGLAISPKDEFVFYSMNAFGTYSKFLMFVTLVFAGLLSILCNYYFGRMICGILSNFENTQVAKSREINRTKVRDFFHKYYTLFLILSIWPFAGKFVQLLAGIYRVNLKKVLFICTICKILYYGYYLII